MKPSVVLSALILLIASNHTIAAANPGKIGELLRNPPATLCGYTTRAANWIGQRLLGDRYVNKIACPLDGDGCRDENKTRADAPRGRELRKSIRADLDANDLFIVLSGENLFQVNSDAPGTVGLQRILQSVHGLKPTSIEKILVLGHSDGKGSSDYNQSLSERRAKTIRGIILKKLKLDPARIVARGFGEGFPIAPNQLKNGQDNPRGRALNRRVEIVVSRS